MCKVFYGNWKSVNVLIHPVWYVYLPLHCFILANYNQVTKDRLAYFGSAVTENLSEREHIHHVYGAIPLSRAIVVAYYATFLDRSNDGDPIFI